MMFVLLLLLVGRTFKLAFYNVWRASRRRASPLLSHLVQTSNGSRFTTGGGGAVRSSALRHSDWLVAIPDDDADRRRFQMVSCTQDLAPRSLTHSLESRGENLSVKNSFATILIARNFQSSTVFFLCPVKGDCPFLARKLSCVEPRRGIKVHLSHFLLCFEKHGFWVMPQPKYNTTKNRKWAHPRGSSINRQPSVSDWLCSHVWNGKVLKLVLWLGVFRINICGRK